MKKLLALVLTLAMVAAMFTMAASAEEPITITVGMMGPETGPYAIYGNGAAYGAMVAVDEINAAGGKYQFVFLHEDDQGDPELAKNAYNTMMDQGMQIVLGAVTSGACMAVAEIGNEERVFCLTPSASNDLVPESGDQIFQICFTDSNQGVASAKWVAENRPEAKVGIIYNNAQDYSMGIYTAFKTTAAELGVNVVAESAFSDDTAADFSVQVAAMKDAGVDFVFLPIYYTPAVGIMTQAASASYAPEYFGVDGMDGVLGVEGLNVDLVQGVKMLTAFDATSTAPGVAEFVAAFDEKFDASAMNQFSADAYDGMYVLLEALTKADVTADDTAEDICEKLVAVMPELTYSGITGEMTWSADGTVSKSPIAVEISGTEYVSAK